MAVLPDRELKDNEPTQAVHDGVPILLVRSGEVRIFALAKTCSHFSGPLAEGKLIGKEGTARRYHNSRFSLEDGRVLDGPGGASTALPGGPQYVMGLKEVRKSVAPIG